MTQPTQQIINAPANDIPLIEVARRMRNSRIDRVVAAFRERHASLIRTIVLFCVTIWTWFWTNAIAWLGLKDSQLVLVRDAIEVLPWAIVFFVVSAVWAVVLRSGWVREREWMDRAGVIANLVFIAVLLEHAFLLLITLNAMLPFINITVSARFSRRAFLASIVATSAILLFTAPAGYWISRPAYALYAILLAIALPLAIDKVFGALREVSLQAIVARDAQTRFVGTMSHELRTPLNTIINAAALVDPRQLDREQRELIDSVATNADVLLHRVNAVLDVAALQGNTMALANEPFRPDALIETVRKVCAPAAEIKGVHLSFLIEGELKRALLGDAGRIEQVLSNLTINAIKFTPQGGSVTVRARCAALDKAIDRFEVSVIDTGVGISDPDKRRIFEPFEQVSVGAGRVHEGIGLGLYIVRSISERMKGHIQVSDRTGGGTVFTWWVELPRAEGDTMFDETSVVQLLSEHRNRVRSMRCLIIEDNAGNRDIIARILSRAGHRSEFAVDGYTGLAAIKREAYDAVFLDLHMPGMNGWEVLTRVRLEVKAPPPLVVISADAAPALSMAAGSLGARGYLTKPIATRRLLDMLEQIAAVPKAQVRPFDDAQTADQHSPLDELRSFGNNQVVRDFLNAVTEGLNGGLRALRRSADVCDKNSALEDLHALKNEFANCGLHSAARRCAVMSQAIHAGTDQPAAVLPEVEQEVANALKHIQTQPEFGASLRADLGALSVHAAS